MPSTWTRDSQAPHSPAAPGAPRLVDAETLLTGLRHLQQRIPNYVHHTPQEAREMGRAAHLDEEFLNAGIHAGTVWDETKQYIGWSGEEMRELADETRRWDDVERELRVMLKGIGDANRERKHTLGTAVLMLYMVLRRTTKYDLPHMRPYYEEMKTAWLRRKRGGKKKNEPEGDGPGTE